MQGMLHTPEHDKTDMLHDHRSSAYLFATALTAILILLQFFQPDLLFQRHLIIEGEFWRLWTGNLVHTNLWHLGLNLAGLWLLTLIQQPTPTPRIWLGQTLFIGTCVGTGLWFFNQELVWYAGFSGILYGLFMLAGIQMLQQKEWTTALLILGGICGKTVWDWAQGGTALSANLIDAPVIYSSHIYGMLGGLALALPRMYQQKRPSS